jgi:hypothetical protein
MYMIAPLLPLLPLFPFPLTWNPPSCDRIRPPLPWVARKLTPVFSSPAHLAPYPKSRPPGVSQTRNRHSLGRHCEPNPYARLQVALLLLLELHPPQLENTDQYIQPKANKECKWRQCETDSEFDQRVLESSKWKLHISWLLSTLAALQKKRIVMSFVWLS